MEHLEVVVFNDEEFQILLGEIFALLNIENMKHNFSKCFEQWISTKTANSRVLYNFLRTLGNIVADNEIMVNLYETAINTYFTNNSMYKIKFKFSVYNFLTFSKSRFKNMLETIGKFYKTICT